jgi:metal-sulfur cluster biosynthetic enzyme
LLDVGRVLHALRGVVDPELGKDVVHLGIIRTVEVRDGHASVTMTPTTAGCPLTDWLTQTAEARIRDIGLEADVRIVLDPPWTPADVEG